MEDIEYPDFEDEQGLANNEDLDNLDETIDLV